jgi:hypothetical protein
MEMFRLTASYVKLGVPMPGDILDEAGNLLLSKGHVITEQDVLQRLLARGMFVDPKTLEAQFKPAASAAAPAVENRHDPFAVHDSLKQRLNRLLRGVVERSAGAAEIAELAGALVSCVRRDAEGAVAASLLDRHEEVYPVGHSLNAAVLCAAIAHRLGWPEDRQRSTICAAMTMNAGMLEYHQRLHRQAAPLSAQQLEQLRCSNRSGSVTRSGWPRFDSTTRSRAAAATRRKCRRRRTSRNFCASPTFSTPAHSSAATARRWRRRR